MPIRKPVVAGQFYGGTREQCMKDLQGYLRTVPEQVTAPAGVVAGIVPHAGWMFSGDVAALVFAAIRQIRPDVDTFVLFGASHRLIGTPPAVFDKGSWLSPLGEIAVDEDLAARIIDGSDAKSNPSGHTGEHSLEVQIPFIQYLFPEARIVPILAPSDSDGARLGEQVAKVVQALENRSAMFIGSTDLTHYGPRYGFAPYSAGSKGIEWAKNVNDRQLIDLMLTMRAGEAQQAAVQNHSACGPAALAATVAAARHLGRKEGVLLAHTTSNEVLIEKFDETSDESVGYAGIVF